MWKPWRESFPLFLEYVMEVLGDRPGPEYTLDRKDPDGHYEPGNITWATAKRQVINRRTFKLYSYRGRSFCIADWARMVGMSPRTLGDRLRQDMPLLQALKLAPFGKKLKPLRLPPCPRHGATCPSNLGSGDCPDPADFEEY